MAWAPGLLCAQQATPHNATPASPATGQAAQAVAIRLLDGAAPGPAAHSAIEGPAPAASPSESGPRVVEVRAQAVPFAGQAPSPRSVVEATPTAGTAPPAQAPTVIEMRAVAAPAPR